MTELDVENTEGVPVARPRGDIDAANASRLREQLAARVDNDTARIIVDLSDTRYVDSAGIDMFLRFSEHLRQRRAKLLLVIPETSPLMPLARLVGLPRAMDVLDTVQQALAADAPAPDSPKGEVRSSG
jgi:anti-anti-sigma factor